MFQLCPYTRHVNQPLHMPFPDSFLNVGRQLVCLGDGVCLCMQWRRDGSYGVGVSENRIAEIEKAPRVGDVALDGAEPRVLFEIDRDPAYVAVDARDGWCRGMVQEGTDGCLPGLGRCGNDDNVHLLVCCFTWH